jgi:putative Mn2+ efflux pump MntP
VGEEHPHIQEVKHEHSKRDAETQMVLGAFIVYITIPVLIGTYWAQSTKAMVVNIIAGLVLGALGAAMAILGYRNNRRLKNKSK